MSQVNKVSTLKEIFLHRFDAVKRRHAYGFGRLKIAHQKINAVLVCPGEFNPVRLDGVTTWASGEIMLASLKTQRGTFGRTQVDRN
jgi:hypothetical protein